MNCGSTDAANGGRMERFAQRLAALPLSLGDTVIGWLERRRERRLLHQVSDHLLKDIGVSRADVEREAQKPFWRA
jgi:uncharacterized protein YjiS (DUF1127 family)